MLENDIIVRLSFFVGILIIMMLWELLRAKRTLLVGRNIRWSRNFILVVLNSVIVKFIVPFTAVGVAIYAEQNHIGLWYYLSIPYEMSLLVSVIFLDFVIYVQHVCFHRVPILWRLHKVHHIDQDIDVTTGLRFHPLEIVISTLIKCGAVLVLGVPFAAVVVFEILLNATAMFNHANVKLPQKLDAWLRLFVVTPDMHRVHHSVKVKELNSNFGFNLPWWDRLFKSYRAQPELGHEKMEIGLQGYKDVSKTGVKEMLIIPFRKVKK